MCCVLKEKKRNKKKFKEGKFLQSDVVKEKFLNEIMHFN